MNYFKAAEQVLLSVRALEQSIENLERREKRLIDGGAPRGVGKAEIKKAFTATRYVNETLNEALELTECSKNLRKTRAKVAEIKTVIGQLAPEHKELVKMWYLEHKPKERIMEAMHIDSLTTVYNIRNKAVGEFALLYYGSESLASI